MSSIEEKKKNRILFLKKLYEISKGSRYTIIRMDAIGKELGFEYSVTSDTAEYLEKEGLIKWQGIGGELSLTHRGIKIIEAQDSGLLAEKEKNRKLFLTKLYEKTDGSQTAMIKMDAVGEELGFDYKTTSDVVEYLIGEGLVKPVALGGFISITHWGVKMIED